MEAERPSDRAVRERKERDQMIKETPLLTWKAMPCVNQADTARLIIGSVIRCGIMNVSFSFHDPGLVAFKLG